MNINEMNRKVLDKNQLIKTIFFGFLIWIIPAMVATLLWDVSANKALIDPTWYNALLGAVWSVNYAIFAYLFFKTVEKDYLTCGLVAGTIWYVINFLLDFLVVVVILNLGIETFLPGMLVYVNNLVITIMIGYLLTKKEQKSE
ncbi:MAG: hypothetical protein GF383_00235 [Candidatus Lokiarchaeota archaeon]|nr:hypothetical protein [Candidatus Lokiarchaeota archaeon]MBD3337522.1 hypothetical protein [Candidatus Lokiarchaeota archaeon]